MATENLLPNANGDEQDWDLNGPATHWEAAASDDDDTTYLHQNQTGSSRDEEFHHAATSASSGKTINKLTLVAKCRHDNATGTAVVNLGLRINGSDYQDAAYDKNINFGLSYVTVSHEFALNPDTGSAWTSTIIDDVQSCFYYVTAPARNASIRLTYCYFIVDYNVADPTSQIILIS
jgi:hypothetical protein